MNLKTTLSDEPVVETSGYHIDPKLKKRWDKIKDGKLADADEDRVYIVDGRERSGKSLFAIQQAAYIDPTFTSDLSRVTFSVEDTLNAIKKNRSTSGVTKVIIWDEAFRGLSSRAALSKTNKKIVQILMEMGQSNLVLFIVLPSFFMLDIYAAILRSNALFHIVKKKGSKLRSFHMYNYAKKAKLYNIGLRKGWNYSLYTKFNGRFFGKWPEPEDFREKYLKKKSDSLITMDEPEKKEGKMESKWRNERDAFITYTYENPHLYNSPNKSSRKASEYLSKAGVVISHDKLLEIVEKYKENSVNS